MTAALGVASFGLGAASSFLNYEGQSAAADEQKFEAESRERIAKIQGWQTEANHLTQLTQTVSNIKAIRASAGVNADSPDTQTIIDVDRQRMDTARKSDRFNAENAAAMARVDSAYYDQAQKLALLNLPLGIANAGLTAYTNYG